MAKSTLETDHFEQVSEDQGIFSVLIQFLFNEQCFSAKALVLNHQINNWMRSSAVGIWETALKDIIQADSFFVNDATIQAPRDYFRPCKYNSH